MSSRPLAGAAQLNRGALDGTVTPLTLFRCTFLVAATLASACRPLSSRPSLMDVPAPCAGNDSVYSITAADSARGLYAARPTDLFLPPSGVHGTAKIRALVSARGHIETDSSEITGTVPRESVRRLRQSLTNYRFFPATLQGCAVRSWWVFSITTP